MLSEKKSSNTLEINRIVCGDSLAVSKTIPDGVIKLIVTSPPYFLARCYGGETLGREPHPQDYLDDLYGFTREFHRILADDGSLYINLGDSYLGTKGFSRNQGKFKRQTDQHYANHKVVKEFGRGAEPDRWLRYKQLLLLPARLAQRMQEYGWILRSQIIWEKTNPLPVHSPDRRYPVYEYIFHFVKCPRYFFDLEIAKQLNHHRDVIRLPVEPFNGHPASFPEALVEPLILTTSRENDLVLDPFAGSGTVCAVAKRHGRQYLGIELNPKYVAFAEQRLANEGRSAAVPCAA